MRFLKIGLPALALMVSVSSASAGVYKCDFPSGGKGGILSEVAFIELQNNNTRAVVLDGLIQGVNGEPLAATVKPLGKNSYRIRWELKDIPTNLKLRVNARYSARINIQSRKANIHGMLTSSMQEAFGRGTCVEQK